MMMPVVPTVVSPAMTATAAAAATAAPATRPARATERMRAIGRVMLFMLSTLLAP